MGGSKGLLRKGRIDSQEVAKAYNATYEGSLGLNDDDLRFSLDRLFINHGVIDPTRDCESERLPIALRLLGYPNLKGKVILDYGCGSGKSAVVLAQAGAKVYGFDISLNSIRIGYRRSKVNGVGEDVHLAVMSADRLGFPSDFFDFIYSYEVLYYLDRKTAYGNEILRVLKPGGQAIFCEAIDGNPFLRAARFFLRTATGTINRTGGIPLRLEEIGSAFGQRATVETYPVNLLSMAKRVIGHPGRTLSKGVLGYLKGIDRFWLERFPGLRRFCGEVVIVVTKDYLPEAIRE